MTSIAKALQQSLRDNLESLLEEFKQHCSGNHGVEYLIERFSKSIEAIENTKPPLIPTRRYLSAIEYLVHSILKFRSILYSYFEHESSLEDLRRGISEYEEAISLYRRVALSERLKTQIYMAMPQLSLFFTIAYGYSLGIRLGIEQLLIVIPLTIMSLAIVYKSPIASYLLNMLAASSLVLLLVTSTSRALSLVIVFTLAILTLFMSITYIHLSYIVTSKKNIEALRKSIEELLASRIGGGARVETSSGKERAFADKILDELTSVYKRLYGEKGSELLKYRLSLFILQGIPREEAIKKLYSEVKEFRETE